MIRLDDNADTFPVGLQGTPFETVYKALRSVAASVWNVDPTAYRAGMAWGWYALHKRDALVGFRDIVTAALISAFAPMIKDTQTDEELVEYLRQWRSYAPTFPKLQALYAFFGLTVDIQPISDPESQAILPVDDTRLAFYIRIESVDFSRPMSLGEVHDLAVRATPLGSRPYPYYSLATRIDVPTAAISDECGITVGDSGIAQLPPMDLILVDDATGRVVNGGMLGDALELAEVHVSHVLVQPACDTIAQGVQLGTLQLDPQVGVELVEEEPVVVLPTVSRNGRESLGFWLYTNNQVDEGSYSTVSSGSSALLWLDVGTVNAYHADVVYAVGKWQRYTSDAGTVGLDVVPYSYGGGTYLGIENTTSMNLAVTRVAVYNCNDLSATVVPVYDSSNVAYNAFKFTALGTDYYYVLDGTQTDWTDDLNSIGYSLTPLIKRGYSYANMVYYGNSYSYLTYTAAGGDYIPPNASKRYVVVSISSSPTFDTSTITLSNSSSPSRLKATCHSPFSGALWYVDYYELDV